MKRNNFLSYSFIPQNTIYSVTNPNSNIIKIYTKTEHTSVDNYSSEYGIPFECVEFIRRFFATHCNYTFPSVIDAEDMFYKVNTLTHISNQHRIITLKTHQYPYGDEKNILGCLKPGSILFWKKANNDNLKYGHVALVISANECYVRIANQNLDPYIKTYNTKELMKAMNNEKSPFLGIKVLPTTLSDFLEPNMNNIEIIQK